MSIAMPGNRVSKTPIHLTPHLLFIDGEQGPVYPNELAAKEAGSECMKMYLAQGLHTPRIMVWPCVLSD